jgi:YD repeat-containing protein
MGFAVLMLAAGPVSAQQPPAEPPAAQEQPAMVEGDLSRVDADAKLLVVKTADGNEVQFSYDDKTEISGATSDAAGLATTTEGRVTVHFKEDAGSKLATKIIVQPKQ